jgi:hypothetical protein
VPAVVLCPASCSAAGTARVDVQTGCATVVQ